MDNEQRSDPAPLAAFIGWCVLAAAITQLPALIAGTTALYMLPKLGKVMLWLTAPVTALLLVGGIGLILRRFWGYYLVYIATFFGGFGGLKVPYVPFIKEFLKLGPAKEDYFLILNLLVVAALVWEHWNRLVECEPKAEAIHRGAIIAIVALGLSSVAFGRAMETRKGGETAIAAELPRFGHHLADLKTTGPISYYLYYSKLQKAGQAILSGRSDEASIQAFAETHKLKQMTEPASQAKFLPMAKAWRLDQEKFPRTFKAEDLYYVGRAKDAPKLSIQIVYRKGDGRFTAQLFGFTTPPAPQ